MPLAAEAASDTAAFERAHRAAAAAQQQQLSLAAVKLRAYASVNMGMAKELRAEAGVPMEARVRVHPSIGY